MFHSLCPLGSMEEMFEHSMEVEGNLLDEWICDIDQVHNIHQKAAFLICEQFPHSLTMLACSRSCVSISPDP